MTGLGAACACGGCASCTAAAARPAIADPLVFRQQAIRARLLARIGSTEIDGRRPLDGLGTRDDDDPTIALLDAYAGALHVLAWNTGRLADDSSIRRTEDRDALVDLARALGYEPRPALSATTTLTFALDDFPGSARVITVPAGTKVASVPGQKELPQIFETATALEARPEWNELKPVLQKDSPNLKADRLTIVNTTTSAKPGDLVLVHLKTAGTATSWRLARISGVVRDSDLRPEKPDRQGRTTLELAPIDAAGEVELTVIAPEAGESFENCVVLLGQRAAAFGATAPDYALVKDTQSAATSALSLFIKATASQPTEETIAEATGNGDWPGIEMSPGGGPDAAAVDLDAVYPDAVPGRFVVFSSPKANPRSDLGRITSATELSRANFGLSGKLTRIGLIGVDVDGVYKGDVRGTTVYIETARETLLLEDADVELPAAPTNRLTVIGTVTMPVGRRLVVEGEPWPGTQPPDPPKETGPRIGEVLTLASSSPSGDDTELVFDGPIASRFRAITVRLLGNAVVATHGETPAGDPELLGSGTAAASNPRFPLKRSPLTFLAAPGARGYAPALEVRVGDRLYDEVPTLYGLPSDARAYTVKVGRVGAADVQFAGHLPSGTFNLTAVYRTGGGLAGNLEAKRLTTAMTPVLGVRGVQNPVPAEGGSDPESIAELRTAAPRSIRTMDRVVSLADYEAFARSRPGVGKVLATELHAGMRSVVCLTIATTTYEPPAPGSEVLRNLATDIAAVATPGRALLIAGFVELTATLAIALAIDPAYRQADVEAAVRTRLSSGFGRKTRQFGAALPRSAILAATQGVPGVTAARLTLFEREDGVQAADGRLPCPIPRLIGTTLDKAGLLVIDPEAIQFSEMVP